MKNIPTKIYLQFGDELTQEEIDELDFNDLSEVSWCSERIYETDIEFVLSDVVGQSEQLGCKFCGADKGLRHGYTPDGEPCPMDKTA